MKGPSRADSAMKRFPSLLAATALLIQIPGAPARGQADPATDDARRSPVVQVVERISPSIVNISTEQKVENPFHQSVLDSFFSNLLDGSGPSRDRRSEQFVQNSLGSGVIIDPRGYILTNEHVLWRASKVHVVLADKRKFEAEVVGVDPRSDLAVLRIDTAGEVPVAKLGTSGDLMIGETVIAIGNPYGLSNTVTTGVLSAVKRSIKAGERVYSDFLQTDASINPGNSGGALLSIKGEVIGINTAILGEARGIGFAIPVDRARKVFGDLLRYGEVRVAWLGLDVKDLDDRAYAALLERGLDLDAEGAVAVPAPGVQVRRVYRDGPGERAGLGAGDLVTRVGDEEITSRTDFETAISKFKSGDRVRVAYRKGNSDLETVLTATAFPDHLAEEYFTDQLGMEVGDIAPELLRRYPRLPREGVIVTRVRNQSRAYYNGFEPGDVLRAIDGQIIKDMESLRRAVPRMIGRDAVFLKVIRGPYQYHVTIEMT